MQRHAQNIEKEAPQAHIYVCQNHFMDPYESTENLTDSGTCISKSLLIPKELLRS